MKRPDQRNLINFAVGDPNGLPTYGEFKEAFRTLHGRLPQGREVLPYLKSHPEELRKLRGDPEPDRKSHAKRRR